MNKEELRNVDGSDSLHPNRSGDVVVVLRPPYQSDAADAGSDDRAVAVLRPARLPAEPRRPEEQHQHARDVRGRRPGRQAQATNVAGLRADRRRADARAADGHPRPAERPRARSSTTSIKNGEDLHEITILDISDWHAQLTPLAETADNLAAPGVNASFAIGGAAFLKPWFDVYEAESAPSSATKQPSIIEVAGGDSFGGATPPISNFFGDKPTPPIMSMMGIDVDALGNHSFDRGRRTCATS